MKTIYKPTEQELIEMGFQEMIDYWYIIKFPAINIKYIPNKGWSINISMLGKYIDLNYAVTINPESKQEVEVIIKLFSKE